LNHTGESMVPRLAVGVRLKFDEIRSCWVILAPERVMIPDEIAVEILRRCDGHSSLSAIIDELATGYDASRELIAQDVCELVTELADKGILTQ
jgi:pyrroloquinoline quinone biosynthesis protein D